MEANHLVIRLAVELIRSVKDVGGHGPSRVRRALYYIQQEEDTT